MCTCVSDNAPAVVKQKKVTQKHTRFSQTRSCITLHTRSFTCADRTVNIRSGVSPSAMGNIVTYVFDGTVFPALPMANGWEKIITVIPMCSANLLLRRSSFEDSLFSL